VIHRYVHADGVRGSTACAADVRPARLSPWPPAPPDAACSMSPATRRRLRQEYRSERLEAASTRAPLGTSSERVGQARGSRSLPLGEATALRPAHEATGHRP